MADNTVSITSEQFIEKLRKALLLNGDFPACAKTVNELRVLASNPNTPANKMSELILRDPSLSTKILNFVNSAFFQRGTQITTISQAVMHIGTKQLAELCSNFTLLQKLVPTARKGGPFALALERLISTSILTSILNSSEATNKAKNEESGYLVGTFSEIGLMLTSYYFPKLFENAHQRSLEKNISLNKSIKQLTGFEPLEISLEVLVTLKMPTVYTASVITALKFKNNEIKFESLDSSQSLTKNLLIAQDISSNIVGEYNNTPLNEIVQNISNLYNIGNDKLYDCIELFSKEFPNHCQTMQIELPPIEKLDELSEAKNSSSTIKNCEANELLDGSNDEKVTEKTKVTMQKYLQDIKESIENDESIASIITTIMESFVWGLNFDRVLLLLVDIERTKLQGRMFLGNSTDNLEPKNIIIPLDITSAKVPSKCFYNGQITTSGELVFPKDSSCIAIPIGLHETCIGVLYASFTDKNNNTISSYMLDIAKGILQELIKLTSQDN